VDFGLLGDYDAMPDLEELGTYLEDALAELLAAAGATRSKAGAAKSGNSTRPANAKAKAKRPGASGSRA
jgi:hypothetical protein